MRTGVLFVCLGNICRSPTAEGVFRHLVKSGSLADAFDIDSAGTLGYHDGSPPDRRSQRAAAARGVDLSALRARQVTPEDFERFHHVLAMDRSNLSELRRLCPPPLQHRVSLFLEGMDVEEVPDPYYGGREGFELVLDLAFAGAERLLMRWRSEWPHGKGPGEGKH
ncbi:MAG: low molecular weight protein-tyrosine-phosphatase [Myxococcota bacterium]